MSYYGYPNAQAYGANYAQYAAAYAAQSGSFDQYQAAAAYNAAAYNAITQNRTGQPQPANGNNNNKPGNGVGGISISQAPQRYDYATMQAQQLSGNGNGAAGPQGAAPGYDAAAYASGMMGAGMMRSQGGPKWGQLPGQPGAAKFNRVRRNPTGAPVQVFYCEVCKISCAGPQTYKEHLDGQKHKKREAATKINEAQALAAATGAPVTSDLSQAAGGANGVRNGKMGGRGGGRNGNMGRTQNSSNLIIQCALCDVACTGKDAYSAHVRGAKHQKTIKLHQKLGKPIPPDALDMLSTKPPAAGGAFPQAAVISAPPQINMNRPASQNPVIGPVDPSTVNTNLTVINTENQTPITQQQQEQPADEEELINIEPIGKEYIETKLEGKILSFYCKLCECQFNDPNAKDMHTKGRRHRLAYKKKVDPSLRVDMKGNPREDSKKRERQTSTQNRLQNKPKVNKPDLGAPGQIKPLMDTDGGGQTNIQQLMSQSLAHATQFNQFGFGSNAQVRHSESFDDRHLIAKHNTIYPSQEEIDAIQEIVSSTEKALKLVSDQIADEDLAKAATPTTTQTNTALKTETVKEAADAVPMEASNDVVKKSDDTQVYRALKGVMRVGLLAKGILLKGDTDVQLIVLCAQKPTKMLLERVYKILLEKIDVVSPTIKYSIILDKIAETLVIIKTTISDLQPLITCKILLTSPAVRTDTEIKAEQDAAAEANKLENTQTDSTAKPEDKSDVSNNTTATTNPVPEVDSADLLDKQRCLDSLASLRHAKWFQARATNVPNCVVIIRVLRDLCRRNPTWAPLTQWGLELLVEKSLSSSAQPLSPGEGLRRVLECVSSGILLPNGPGLYDPCEKEPTDVSDILKNQQREELTSSAQMALRLLAFKQIYKILGMECLNTSYSNKVAKKRQHSSTENECQIEEKKEKIQEETEASTITSETA